MKAEALDLREQLTEQDVGNENHPKLIELRQTTHAFFLMRKRVVGKVEKKKKTIEKIHERMDGRESRGIQNSSVFKILSEQENVKKFYV